MISMMKFTFAVNETCNAFMVPPTDKDVHNPLLIHFTPSDMTWNEQRTYIPYERNVERKRCRKERQKSKKRKGNPAEEEEGEGDEGPWLNFTAQEWREYQAYQRRQQCGSAYGRSSASSSHQWRPKHR